MVIKSHIQPQKYLKGFLAPKENELHNDSVYVYKKGMPFQTEGTSSEKNPALKGINNTGFVDNFYSFLNEDGVEDPEKYENKLQREIENPTDRVFDKLRTITLACGQSIYIRKFLEEDEQIIFARYIAGMLARTKAARKLHDDTVRESVKNTNHVGLSFAEITTDVPSEEKERVLTRLRAINPDFDEQTGRFSLPPKFSADFTDKHIKGEAFPKGIFRIIAWFSELILSMKWQIRLLPEKTSLPTGDEPVFWTDMRHPDAVLLFSISSTALFCAYRRDDAEEIIYLDENPEVVYHMSKSLASKCQELYSSIQEETLVNLLNSG